MLDVENAHLEFEPSLLSREELGEENSILLESGFFYIALEISIDRFISCCYFTKLSLILDRLYYPFFFAISN